MKMISGLLLSVLLSACACSSAHIDPSMTSTVAGGAVTENGYTTFSYDGIPVAKFKNGGEVNYGRMRCDNWRQAPSIRLNVNSKNISIIQIECILGEFSNNALLLPDGKILIVYTPPLPSPSGKYFAVGSDDYEGDYSTGGLRIFNSSNFQVEAQFSHFCRPQKWNGDTKLAATCISSDGDSENKYSILVKKEYDKWVIK